MGDVADLTLEQAELETPYGWPNDYNPLEYWKTYFNNLVKITNMTTQHLENTCAMLERNDNQSHPSYFALVAELEKRVKP